MRKNILFITDELEFKYFEFNKLVTNFWLIHEFLKRGYSVHITTKGRLFVENNKGKALCYPSYSTDENIFFDKKAEEKRTLNDFDIIFFRPDPPVDTDYISACYVFNYVDPSKTCTINNPLAIKDFNEKFHINYFPEYTPKNIVTASKTLIKEFISAEGEVILKPLNRCFGSGVYYLKNGDKNINTIINSITNEEKSPVMVQKYINSEIKGDKRVLIAGKKVFDECVYKLASSDDFKFNDHCDKYFRKASLTPKEKQAALDVAEFLNKKGLWLAGLDVMDEKIIEINITSPCYFIKEINNFYNANFEIKLVDTIEEIADNYFSSMTGDVENERCCAV